jgi:hypothetical protein
MNNPLKQHTPHLVLNMNIMLIVFVKTQNLKPRCKTINLNVKCALDQP